MCGGFAWIWFSFWKGWNIRNLGNYWLGIQAAFPSPNMPVIKLMLTLNLTHVYLYFIQILFWRRKALFIDLWLKSQHMPILYIWENWSHSVCKWQGLNQSLHPEIQPRLLVVFFFFHTASSGWNYIDKKKKRMLVIVRDCSYNELGMHWSLLLMSCLLPGHEFRKHFLVYSHEVYSKMASSSSLLGKNWMLAQPTLFLSPKIPLLLMMPIFLMGNRERVQFLYGTIQAVPQGRLILGKVMGISLQVLS